MRISLQNRKDNETARTSYQHSAAAATQSKSFAHKRKRLITLAALVMTAALLMASLLGVSDGTSVLAADSVAFDNILNNNIGLHPKWAFGKCLTAKEGGVGDTFTNQHKVWRANVDGTNDVILEKSPSYVFTGEEVLAGDTNKSKLNALATQYNLKRGNDVVFNITDSDTAAKVWADAVAFAQSLGEPTAIADPSLAGTSTTNDCGGTSAKGENHAGFRVGTNTDTRNKYQGNFFIKNETVNGQQVLGQYITVRLQTDWTAKEVTTTAPLAGSVIDGTDYIGVGADGDNFTTTSFNYILQDKNTASVFGGDTYLPLATSGYTRIGKNGQYIVSVDIASNSCDYDSGDHKVFNDNCAFSFGRINVPTGVYIVLDLNGHTIDRALNPSLANYYGSVFHISSEARLEIMDSTAYENASSARIETKDGADKDLAATAGYKSDDKNVHISNHKGTITGGYTSSSNKLNLPSAFQINLQNLGGGFNLSMWADLVVHSGTVSNNVNGGGAGGAFYQRSKAAVTVYDGYVLDNQANSGGVTNLGSGSGCPFTMYGGVLAYNLAANGCGGAVNLAESSYGNFHGGEIVHNKAASTSDAVSFDGKKPSYTGCGGGIALAGNTLGILDSVTISDNEAVNTGTAKDSDYPSYSYSLGGGGVFVSPAVGAVDQYWRTTDGVTNHAFKFRGSLQIYNNKAGSNVDNVHLGYGFVASGFLPGLVGDTLGTNFTGYSKIGIGGALFANGIVANVGVTVGDSGDDLVFTSGYSTANPDRDAFVYFSSDNSKYQVINSSGEGELTTKNITATTKIVWVITGTGTDKSGKDQAITINADEANSKDYSEAGGISYNYSGLTCEYGMLRVTKVEAHKYDAAKPNNVGDLIKDWSIDASGTIQNGFTETNFRFKLGDRDFVDGEGGASAFPDEKSGSTATRNAIKATDNSISYAGEYSFLLANGTRYDNPSFKIKINQTGVEASSELYYKGRPVSELGWNTEQNGVGVDWNGNGTIDDEGGSDEVHGIDWSGDGFIQPNSTPGYADERNQSYFVYSGQYYYPILSADFKNNGILRVYDSQTKVYHAIPKSEFTGYVLQFRYANAFFGENKDIDFNTHSGAGVSYQTLHRAPGQIQGVGTYVGGVMHAGMYSVTFISANIEDTGAGETEKEEFAATGVYYAANNFAFDTKINIYVKPTTAEVQLTEAAQANLTYRGSAFSDSDILLFDNTANTSVNPLIDSAANMEYYLFDDLTFAPGVYDRRTKRYYTFEQMAAWVKGTKPQGVDQEAPTITFSGGEKFTTFENYEFPAKREEFDKDYKREYAYDTDAYLVYILDTQSAGNNLDYLHRVDGGPVNARHYVVVITLDLDADYTDYDYVFDQDSAQLVGLSNRTNGDTSGKTTYFWAFEFTVDPAVVTPYDFDVETPAPEANTSVTVSRHVTYNGLGQFQLPQLSFNAGVARQLVGSAAKVDGNKVDFNAAAKKIYANSALQYNDNFDFVVRYKIAEYGFDEETADVEKKTLDYKNVTVGADKQPTKLVARIYIPAWKENGVLTGATGNYTFDATVTNSDDFGTYYEITWEIDPVTVTLSLTVSYAYDGTSREDDYVPWEGEWQEGRDPDIRSGKVGYGVGGIWAARPGYPSHAEGFVFPFNILKDGKPVNLDNVGPEVGVGKNKYTISNAVYTFSDEAFLSNNVTFGGGVYTFDTGNADVGNYALSTLTSLSDDTTLVTHQNTAKLAINAGVVWIVAFDDNNGKPAEKGARPLYSSQGFNGSANTDGQYGNFVVNTTSSLSVNITPKDISEDNVFATDIQQTAAGKTLDGYDVDAQGYIPVQYGADSSTQQTTEAVSQLATFPYAGNSYVYRPLVKVAYYHYGVQGSTSDKESSRIEQLDGDDYSLDWADNNTVSNTGDHWTFAQVLVTGKNNYTGSLSVSFRIRPARIKISHVSHDVSSSFTGYDFNGDSDTTYCGYYFDRAAHQLQLSFENVEDYTVYGDILRTVRGETVSSVTKPVITIAEVTYGYTSKAVFDAIAYAKDGTGYFDERGNVKADKMDDLKALYTEIAPVDADVYYVAIALSNENYEFQADNDAFPLIKGADYGVSSNNLARGTFEIKPAEVSAKVTNPSETYNRLAHNANLSFTNSRDANVVPTLDQNEFSVTYSCGAQSGLAAVTDAGKYLGKINVNAHDWINQSALTAEHLTPEQQEKIAALSKPVNFVWTEGGEFDFEITAAEIVLNGFANGVYNAATQTAAIVFANNERNNDAVPVLKGALAGVLADEYTVTYGGAGLDGGFPKNAGTYTVTVSLANGAASNSNNVPNFKFVSADGTTVTADGNSVSANFTIDPATVSMQVSSSSINFDGKAHVPVFGGSNDEISFSFINTVNESVLPVAADFSVSYKYTPRGGSETSVEAANCIHVGSYVATVTLNNQNFIFGYTWGVDGVQEPNRDGTVSYTIMPRLLTLNDLHFVHNKVADVTPTVDDSKGTLDNTPYTGNSTKPTLKVVIAKGMVTDNLELTQDTNYTYMATADVNVGEVTLTVTGIDDYTGTLTITYHIDPAKVSVAVKGDASTTYNGYNQMMEFTFTNLDGNDVVPVWYNSDLTDYTVTYVHQASGDLHFATVTNRQGGPVHAGTYNVTVTVTDGNFQLTGNAKFTFTINKATLTLADFSSVVYNAEEQPVSGLIFNSDGFANRTLLPQADDYTITYDKDGDSSTPVNAGKYNVTVTLKNKDTATGTDVSADNAGRFCANDFEFAGATNNITKEYEITQAQVAANLGVTIQDWSDDGTKYQAGSTYAGNTYTNRYTGTQHTLLVNFVATGGGVTPKGEHESGTWKIVGNKATVTYDNYTVTIEFTASADGKFNDTTRVQAAGTYTLTIALNAAIDGNFDLINGTEFVYTITPATIVGSVDSISSSYDPDNNYKVETPDASNFSSELQKTYRFSGYVFNPTVKITSVTGVVADEGGNYKLSQVGTYTVYYTVTATDHNPLSGSFTVTVSNTSIYIDISRAAAITKVYGISDSDLLTAFWELVKTCNITTTSKDHPLNDTDQAVDWLQKHVTVSFQGESRSTAKLLEVGSYRVNLSATRTEDAGVSVQFRYNRGRDSVTSQIALVTITPKLVTASGATFSEKVYDGNAAAIVSSVGSFGVDEIVESDNVTLSASGVYNSANVSEASQITVTYTMGGADANNYTFDNKNGVSVKTTTATVADQKITPKSATVHWTDKSFTYSGKTPNFDLTKLAYYLTVDNKQVYLVVYVQGKGDASTFVNNGEYTLEVGSQQYGESGAAEAFSSNYTLENNTHNYTINKATITVSGMKVTSKVYNGTDECPIGNVTGSIFAGLFDEETPTLLKAVFDGVTAGGHNVTVYIRLPSDNYTLSGSREVVSGSVEGVKGDNLCSVTVFGTIDRKQLTVKGGFTVEDKVYDGNPTALVKYDDDKSTAVTGSTNLSGLVGSDDVKVTVTARFASANVLYSGAAVAPYTYKGQKSDAADRLELTFVLFGSDSGNYVLTAEPYSGETAVSATITRRTLNVSMTADSRTYNGKDDATVHVTLSGFISGEDNYLTTDTSDIVAHFNNKNVGQSKTVTAKITYAVVGDAAEHAGASKNYYFEATSLVASANVTPIVLDVSVKATFTDDREYDGTQNATPNNLEAIREAVLAKKIDGDTVNLNVTGVYNSKDVATADKITVTYTLTGADAGNYTLVDNHNTTVTTKWEDPEKTTGQILPKKVNVQWSDQEFTYSGKDHKFDLTKLAYYTTIDIDGGARVYLQVASYDKDGGSATDFVNAGEYMLKLVQADSKYQQYSDSVAGALDSNYELQGTLSHNYTIKQAEVTLTVTVPSKVYDGKDTCDKNKVVVSGKSGLFDGDLETVIKAVFKNVVVGRQNVEVYIELGANYRLGGDANPAEGEYDGRNVYVVTTTAEITKATLTIKGGFTVEDKVYDGNTTALVKYTNTDVTAVTGLTNLSGLVGSDDVKVTVTARFASANVLYSGAAVAPYTYKGQKSDAADRLELTFVLFGSDSGNYELDVENPYTGDPVSATITRRTLTPSMAASDKEYNGDDIADIEIKLNGFIQGEDGYLTVDLTGIEAHFDSKNVGQNKSVTVFFTYAIVKDEVKHEGASKNYYFEDTSLVASADVTPIVLEIGTKATFTDRKYDGTQNATPNNLEAIRKAVLSGIIHDDEVSLDVTGEYNTKNVATANNITVTYTLTGADAGNYTLVDNGGTKVTTKWTDPNKTAGKILPKQVELHWNDQEFTYRGQTPNFDLTKLAYYTTIDNDGSRTVYLKVATYDQDGTATKAFVDAGTYTFKLADESGYIEYLAGGGEVAFNSNYAFVEATTHNYTINQAEVTLTVAVLSKVYDGTDLCENNNVSISGRSGLFDGDLETVIKAVFKGVAVGRQNVDVYIKLGVNYRLGGDANLDTGEYDGQNVYVVTVASEITSKEVSVEWTIDGGSLVYNGTDQLGSIHASWEDVGGDKNTLGFKITTFNDAPYDLTTALHAGVYKVVADELDPEFAANYKLVNTEFSFTINKAKVKVVGIKVLNKEFDNNIIATVDISGVKFEIENKAELAVNELGLYGTDSLNVLASGVFDEPDIRKDHVVTVNVTLYGASVADYELADGQAVQTFENVEISSRVWIVDTNYGDEGSGWRWTKKGNTYEVELGIMQESNNAIKDVIKMAGESGVGGIVLTAHTKTDATCTTDGEIYFTATATYGSTTFSYEPGVRNYSEKTAIVPAFGHTWVLDTSKGTDGWTWSHDGGHTAQVHIVCETCGTEHALSATVDSPRYSAECTRDVYVTYTAIVRIYVQSQGDPFTVNDTIEGETQHTYTSSDVVTVPYTGHDWRIDTTDAADSDGDGWTWSEDFTRATVHFICNNCGEQHSTYTTSSIVNIPVGCENDGMDEATVTVTREAIVALLQRTDRDTFVFILDESLTARRTFNVVLATGHNWGEPVWNWQIEADGYSATATFECGNCHNKQDVVATVTNVIQPATCTEDGKQTYTATATPPVSKAGDPAPAAVSEDKVIAIPATGHHWYADASVNGNGWTWQEDGSGATLSLKCDCGETLLLTAETSMLNKQDVTCTEDGYTTYKGTLSESVARTQPNVTEKDVFDGVVWESTVQLQHIDALGHSWVVDVDYADSDNGWSWSQDGDGKWSAVLHLVCEHDGEHTMNVNAKVVAGEKTYPDCVSDGTITYTASVNLVNDDVNAYNVSAEEQTSQHVETIAPRGHSWVLDTDYTDSTRGWNWYDAANSVVAHFECEHDCGTALDVTVTTDNEATYTVSDRHGDVSLTVEVSGSIEVTKRDGTCTVGGGETRKVTINLEGSTFSNEHIVEERSPLGHSWVADTVTDESWQEGWEWTYSDGEWHATLHLRCERCGELLSFDGTVVAGTRKDPTCTAEGSQDYTAVAAVTVEFDGTNRSSFTETLPATGHKFVNEPDWVWNVDDSHYTVTATFTCSQCEATLTVVADTVGIVSQTLTLGDSAPSDYDVSGKIVVEAESTASCTEEGVVSLSVLLQVEGNSFSTSYRQENAVLGHVFDGEPEHHNVDGRHFHTYTCTRCGEGKLEEDCTFDEVVTEPTCEDDGYTTFTCARCGYSYTESGASATGHDYYVVWGEWNSETHTVEAELKCRKCEFSYKPEVTVTAEMLSPACEEDGERTYKASFVYDGTTYENENVLTETVPATGHNWTLDVSEGKSGWTWERDPASDKWTAKAHFKCTNDGCDEKQTLEADVNVKSQPATCTSDRLDILDARVSLDGVVYTASYTEYIEGTKTDHVFDRYVHVEEGGVHKHEIRCSICNELQKTEECTFETDKSDPTCTSGGYTRQKCTECGYVLSGSEKYFDAKGHAWTVNADAVEDTDGTADGWLWQLNEDGSYTVTVYLVCPDCGLEDSAVASVDSRVTVAPTCELQGTRVYTAVASKDGKEFTAELSADIPVDLDAHVWELDTDYPDSENGWIWTETDGKWTATAHFVCKNGCEATRSETDEEPDEVRTGEGSCTNPHTIVYTAEVVVDGQSYISTKVDYVAAESHNWIVDTSLGDDGWSWVGDPENGYTSASVHLKCTKCNDVQTVPTVITTNTIPATCQEGAYIVYTAYATLDGSPFYQSKQGARGEPSETHSWTVWTETKTPDCTNKGEEQRTCTVCGKTETRDIPARGHVWSEWTIDPNGKTESRHCQNCDVIETKVIGGDHLHVWSEEPTWQWSDDHSAATATFTCSICGNREIVDATVTSEDKGDYTTFTAMVEFEGETYSIKIDIANAAPSDNTDYGDFGPAVVYIFGQIIILIVAAIVLNRKNKKK